MKYIKPVLALMATICLALGFSACSDKHKHNYTENIIEPTCTQQGYTIYTCEDCGISYIDNYKDALGHIKVDFAAQAPSCTTEGRNAFYICERCGYSTYSKDTEIAPAGHTFENGACVHCLKPDPAVPVTLGLEYTEIFSENSVTSYAVSGIGTATEKDIKIPTVINEKYVTAINLFAFTGSDITSVTLPESLKNIEEHAFRDCKNLKSVKIPNSIIDINPETFSGCSSLTSVTLPTGLKHIYNFGFSSCTNLKEIKLPDSLELVGLWAFSSCTNLERIELPEGLTAILNCAFYYCENLTELNIPNSVVNLGQQVFSGCTKLKKMSLPDGITKLNPQVFYDCESLESVTLPKNITSIARSAFGNCTNLSEINYKGTTAQWNDIEKHISWNDNTGNFTVHCSDGNLDKDGNKI